VTPLILFEAIKNAASLPGAPSPMYLRTFRTARPAREHRFTFQSIAEALDSAATSSTLLSGISFAAIPPDSRSNYALIVNAGGEFQTVDELLVEHVSINVVETFVQFALTRVESADGEPAPVDVFLIVPLTAEIARTSRVSLTFSVSYRSYDGNVTALEHAIPACVVPLT
jgi:hypothetical protein